jgi:cell division protein FtsW
LKQKTNKKVDPVILSIVLILMVFGLVMISSAGVIFSSVRFGDEYHLLKRHFLYGIIIGLPAMYLVSKINYHFWEKIALPFFGTSLFLLILVLISGVGVNYQGASRWIDLGPISFQPSEVVKISVIIYLASWLKGKGSSIEDFKQGLIPFLIILGGIALLIISQPDIGTLGVIVMISLIMFYVAGAPIKYIIGILLGGMAFLGLLIKLEPYRMSRLTAFLNPSIDPQGISYQINQALLAVGSGGFLGLGLGHSRQKFNYLPEPAGDSIFAVISEELGMIGAVVVILLFVILALKGYRVARFAPDKFGKLVAVGIVSWIVFQALVNIMSILKLMPLTGITLPFISYGSTSLVFTLIGVGILLNISKYSKS